MLTILQMFRKLWRALNGDVSPFACGAAVFIGCLIGLTPLGAQTVMLLLLLLIFTVPVSLALLTSAALKLVDLAFAKTISASLGESLLAAGSASRSLVVSLLDIPVVGLVPLERHTVLGGFILGLILGALLWWPVMFGIRSYRRALQERVTQHKWYRVLGKFSWAFGGALRGGKMS